MTKLYHQFLKTKHHFRHRLIDYKNFHHTTVIQEADLLDGLVVFVTVNVRFLCWRLITVRYHTATMSCRLGMCHNLPAATTITRWRLISGVNTRLLLKKKPNLTLPTNITRSIWKMLGPFATTSCLTPIQQMSLAELSRAACASMSTTSTTTTTRDRGDRYGPMEWVQLT